jgi:hypothetical protein
LSRKPHAEPNRKLATINFYQRREKDYICFLSRFCDIQHSKTIPLADRDRFAALLQTDDDSDAAILEVQGLRMPLRSEADDSAEFVLQIQQVRIFV